jgi:hypothetical protein
MAPDADPQPAPRARTALAGLIDAGLMALPTAVVLRRTMRVAEAGDAPYRPPRWISALAPAFVVLGEQLATPGDWIMGVRTVDKRTGARIALWRTLTVALVRIAARRLARQLRPRPVIPTDMERRQRSEIEAIEQRHRDDEEARNAALMRHYSEHRVNPSAGLWRVLAGGLGSVLVNRVVRRRLAPTVVIDARDHNP